jgi:hypothetical protein
MQLVICNMSNIQQVVLEFLPEAKLLASGFQGSVYALNDVTVVKSIETCGGAVWSTFKDGDVLAEVLSLQWANSFNDLVVKIKEHIPVQDIGDLIMMERLFPCLPTAFTVEEITLAIEVAEEQLQQLWESGWTHGDIKRQPCVLKVEGNNVDGLYNNIMLTEVNGRCVIRLVDLGYSMLEQYDDNDIIDRCLVKDKEDWSDFKEWILNYPRQH